MKDQISGNELLNRAEKALSAVAAAQDALHRAADPVLRFMALVAAAIAAGRAHVADLLGGCPDGCVRWGWRSKKTGSGKFEREEYLPMGERIGWTDNMWLFLNPEAAFVIATVMAGPGGLGITAQTLWKRLHERGLLTTEPSRPNLRVRKQIEGARRHVIQVRADVLEQDHPSGGGGPVPGSSSQGVGGKWTAGNAQNTPQTAP